MVVPVEDELVNNDEEYIQLRNTFLENLNSNGNYEDYEPVDIERLRNDDHYCKRFILHKKGRFNDALQMVDEALKWRKSFGVKDVTLACLPLEFFQAKAVFPFNKDKNDNPIIMLLVRYHKTNSEFAADLRRFVIYWVELMEEQTKGGQMTVIMSCEGAGLSNLDLDLIKFLITLFRSYYPHSLAHILIYQMPWILQPAWKIIKAWLPEDFVDKIKFVNKITLQDYVTPDNLPVDMGGTDSEEYVPPTEEDIKNSINNNKRLSNGESKPSQVTITDDYAVIGGILKISPAVNLVFTPPFEENYEISISLVSVSEQKLSYKVKTNNIECYKVKPSMGILEPGEKVEVKVNIIKDFNPLPTDKFLIMATEVPDSASSSSNLTSLWKTSPQDKIADHKLRCVVKKVDEVAEMDKTLQNMNQMLSSLQSKIAIMESRQSSIEVKVTISLILIVFLICMFFSFILSQGGLPLPTLISKFF